MLASKVAGRTRGLLARGQHMQRDARWQRGQVGGMVSKFRSQAALGRAGGDQFQIIGQSGQGGLQDREIAQLCHAMPGGDVQVAQDALRPDAP